MEIHGYSYRLQSVIWGNKFHFNCTFRYRDTIWSYDGIISEGRSAHCNRIQNESIVFDAGYLSSSRDKPNGVGVDPYIPAEAWYRKIEN
jgi:hypothetical protein